MCDATKLLGTPLSRHIIACLVMLVIPFDMARAGLAEGVAARERGDHAAALVQFTAEAARGNAVAQLNLGRMYAAGQGVPADDQQAISWFRKAADQGDARAQSNLGVMYETGRGVTKDERQAVNWYRKAADQGEAGAQTNLGRMYADGSGVTKDDQQAYFWVLLASAEGDENAKRGRETLERKLSPSQLAAAQTAARNWKPIIAANAAAPDAVDPFAPRAAPSTPVAPKTTAP